MVGASLAGLRAIEALRRAEYQGSIVAIGREPHAPYDRPPLSKKVLSGDWEPERAMLKPADKLDELEVDWRLGVEATGLDLEAKVVATSDGPVPYDGLIIATGARVRHLPGTEGVPGVHVLRTLDESAALKADLEATTGPVVVIGAGFIGGEVAATVRGAGRDVTIVEAAPVPLARVLGPDVGSFMTDLHRSHGTTVELGVGVDGIDTNGGDGRVSGVRLADGRVLPADIVVVGIGVVPETDWLEGSGLTLDNGVVCDETCLAAPGVVACGDVARWPNPMYGEVMRVEQWENAVDQGQAAARRLLAGAGPGEPYAPVPWFWSDQYDRKIQLAGICGAGDIFEIIDGSLDEMRFAALVGRGDRVVGVLAVNRPRPVMIWRNRIAEGMSWIDALELARSEAEAEAG